MQKKTPENVSQCEMVIKQNPASLPHVDVELTFKQRSIANWGEIGDALIGFHGVELTIKQRSTENGVRQVMV